MRQETKDTIRQSYDILVSRRRALTFNAVVTVLALLLIHFKVHGIITWSWFWVTLPIWGAWAFLIIGFPILAFVSALIIEFLLRRAEKREAR